MYQRVPRDSLLVVQGIWEPYAERQSEKKDSEMRVTIPEEKLMADAEEYNEMQRWNSDNAAMEQ